ncbi:MAG: indole-3-glycerol phosphate synthase TrpC [Defluviicoccus sp.]|nr:MAG: indole-3-glycerol phosphate synthase TrpC [Defluviicoccus sp.]
MSVLAKICETKRIEIASRKAEQPFSALEAATRSASPPRGFETRLRQTVEDGRFGLITEIKRASPSKGLIRADFDPPSLARAYAAGGATCLSVLTDKPYFQGDDTYLAAARAEVALPVLRKDFMLDPWQIVEARAISTDCVLLILAAIDDGCARELAAVARQYGMDVLVEVHDEAELQRALALEASMIGINNRNLKTLSVDLAVTEALASMVPPDRLLVGESGIATRADLDRLAAVGSHCFLVGESLMREPDVGVATRRLLTGD